jgi:Ferric reductase like transmembrane component
VNAVAATIDGRALWYLTRGTGAVSLLLLTLSVVLGVADVQRLSAPRMPRFVVDGLHRTVSLLVVVTLAIHVATTLLDSFAPIRLIDAVVPFFSAYRPLWIGFGALALDLLLAITVTSILRARLGYRAWRGVHWLAYACWPVALLHGLGSGSDVQGGFALVLSLVCASTVVVAVLVRLHGSNGRAGALAAGLALLAAAGVALALWLPSGPLAPGWAARSGTPTRLLASVHRPARRAAPSHRPRSAQPKPLPAQLASPLAGHVSEVVSPRGALVQFSLALQRGPFSRLRVELHGQALPGGGVSLSWGQVSLGSDSNPTQYAGPVLALQGGQLHGALRGHGTRRLRLSLAMHVDRVTSRVSGAATLSPSGTGA